MNFFLFPELVHEIKRHEMCLFQPFYQMTTTSFTFLPCTADVTQPLDGTIALQQKLSRVSNTSLHRCSCTHRQLQHWVLRINWFVIPVDMLRGIVALASRDTPHLFFGGLDLEGQTGTAHERQCFCSVSEAMTQHTCPMHRSDTPDELFLDVCADLSRSQRLFRRDYKCIF